MSSGFEMCFGGCFLRRVFFAGWVGAALACGLSAAQVLPSTGTRPERVAEPVASSEQSGPVEQAETAAEAPPQEMGMNPYDSTVSRLEQLLTLPYPEYPARISSAGRDTGGGAFHAVFASLGPGGVSGVAPAGGGGFLPCWRAVCRWTCCFRCWQMRTPGCGARRQAPSSGQTGRRCWRVCLCQSRPGGTRFLWRFLTGFRCWRLFWGRRSWG